MSNAKLVEDAAACLLSACASYGDPVSVSRMASLMYDIEPWFTMEMAAPKLAARMWDVANRKLNASAKLQREHTADSLRDDYALACSLLRNHEIPVGKGRSK